MNAIEPLSADMNAESACKSIIRLLDSVTINTQSSLTYAELEKAIKAALYIDECVNLFGRTTLWQHCNHPIYKRVLQSNDILNGTAIKYVLNKIVQTKNATDHIFAVESILKSVKSPEEIDALWNLDEIMSTRSSIETKRHEHMQLIVQRLFKLSMDHIDIAVERLLGQVHFMQLGLVFCEPEHSLYITKYIVLGHKICTRLTDGKVLEYFVHSMLDTIRYFDDEGIHFYWKCLSNESFAQALGTYFLACMNKTENVQSKDDSIATLVSAALRDESSCQRTLYDKLYNAHLSTYWQQLFHSAVFVFD